MSALYFAVQRLGAMAWEQEEDVACAAPRANGFAHATQTITFPDNLAVSAQGFRRGANRVRKVRNDESLHAVLPLIG